MEPLGNGMQHHFGATPLFSLRTVSLASTLMLGVNGSQFSTFKFFHNSRLIRQIEQKYFPKFERLDQELNPDGFLNSHPLLPLH